MQRVMVKLKKLIVDQTDTKNNKFYLTVYYEENGNMNQIKKAYDFNQTTDSFAEALIKEIKQKTMEKYCTEEDEDDPLCNYVNVMMTEKEEGQQQEKLAGELKRLKEKVKNFKSMKMSTDYINKYQELSTLRADL